MTDELSQKLLAPNRRMIAGDRPTGKLHIGHFVGTLHSRVLMQDTHELFVMIADSQALTDNFKYPGKLRESTLEVMTDYLAVGLSPEKVIFGLQSALPQISELTGYLGNLASLGKVLRNPTVKDELRQKGFEDEIPFGFAAYPVSQAADILIVNASFVGGGDDQAPMVELTRELGRSFNHVYGPLFVDAQLVTGPQGRLPGIDGAAKMGKSLGNVIYLGASNDEIAKAVNKMYTDSNRIRATDPGKIEGNMVFTYLDAFKGIMGIEAEVDELKEKYQVGGVGDVSVKRFLTDNLILLLTPIRERREQLEKRDIPLFAMA
jgi:tryptophanyl-tRNA synthetase